MVSSLRQRILVLLTSAQLCTDHSPLAQMNSLLLDPLQYRCSATGNSSQESFPVSLPSSFLTPSPAKSSYLQLLVRISTLAAAAQLVLKNETQKSNMWDEEFRSVENHRFSSQEEHYCNTVSITALQGSSYLPRNSEKQ